MNVRLREIGLPQQDVRRLVVEALLLGLTRVRYEGGESEGPRVKGAEKRASGIQIATTTYVWRQPSCCFLVETVFPRLTTARKGGKVGKWGSGGIGEAGGGGVASSAAGCPLLCLRWYTDVIS